MKSYRTQRVSLFARVLAWIIFAVFAIAVPLMIKQMLEGSWTMSRPVTIVGVLSMIFILPLFIWVAIKGSAPRWWTPIDDFVKRASLHSQQKVQEENKRD